MDQHRKYAYRYLLFYAMLNIRPVAWAPHKSQWLSPFFWWRHTRRVWALGELADCFHNLADFSMRDFEGLDEQRFWDEFERLRIRHPMFEFYPSLFENALIHSQTGRWPTIEEQRQQKRQ